MSRTITRRRAVAGLAGATALSSCARKPRPGSEPRVAIIRAAGYTQDLYGKVRRLVEQSGLDVRGKRVVVKPNLVEFDPGTSINTNPLLVHAVVEAFRGLGASDVRIAEGPGHRRVTWDLAEAAGYFAAVPEFERCFTDLNLDDVAKVALRRNESRLGSLYLPKTVLGCDLLVSVPKMKTHHWVGATLSMKNFFGLVPGGVYGWPKNILHWAGIHECIADLHATFPQAFAIVDGIEGMEGNGPIQGTPKSAGVIVAGGDLAAVDATCCRIMRIDPARIHYLGLASDLGQTTEANVKQIGEPIRTVQTEFALLPAFQSLRI